MTINTYMYITCQQQKKKNAKSEKMWSQGDGGQIK